MPQDSVTTKLTAAKGALATAKKVLPSAPKATATVTPAPKPVAKAANPSIGDELHAKAANIQEYVNGLPKMHTGGIVKKDGPVNLKKNEIVLPPHKDVKNLIMNKGIAALGTAKKKGMVK
jgi:hypothetical protein